MKSILSWWEKSRYEKCATSATVGSREAHLAFFIEEYIILMGNVPPTHQIKEETKREKKPKTLKICCKSML